MIKRTVPYRRDGTPAPDEKERDFIFFNVTYNHFRDVSNSTEHAVTDREEWAQCECALCLPESYTDDGPETPLILSCHGAGNRVSESENIVGGVLNVINCVDAGYAVMDVCGSEPHGTTMGCPEHIFALYKAYQYVRRHYNVSDRVLVVGASMGGHTAMNFANTFPNLVTAIGLFYPRLNMDSVEIDGHTCIGTWDKRKVGISGSSTHDRLAKIYRFPSDEWCEQNTVGFNPYRCRSFLNSEGQRVVIPPCPIKIWQGLDDKGVDPVLIREYVDSVRRSGSYIELHLLEGIGHSISPVMRQELVMWLNRFI